MTPIPGRKVTLYIGYTCTKSLIDMLFFVALKTLDTFTKSSLVNSVQIIVNYRSSNFVCHHWACISIYRPLSYPLLSLLYSHLGHGGLRG